MNPDNTEDAGRSNQLSSSLPPPIHDQLVSAINNPRGSRHPNPKIALPLATVEPADVDDPPAANAETSTAREEAQEEALEWSRIPFELLRIILLWTFTLTGRQARPLYMFWASLVCRGWKPAASSVLWQHVRVDSSGQFEKLAPGSEHSSRAGRDRAACIRSIQFCGLISRSLLISFCSKLSPLRGLRIHTLCDQPRWHSILTVLPTLAEAISFGREFVWDQSELAKVLKAIARLEFLRLPRYCGFEFIPGSGAAIGVPLRVWAPTSDQRIIKTAELPNLHTIELKLLLGPSNFIHNLVSLRPPLSCLHNVHTILPSEIIITTLLSACPTIVELTVIACSPFTDFTLAALEHHPPLRLLDIRIISRLAAARLVDFLHGRGSALRSLRLENVLNVILTVVDAIPTHTRNLEAHWLCHCPEIIPVYYDTQFSTALIDPDNLQFLAALACGCPLLKQGCVGHFEEPLLWSVATFLGTLGGLELRDADAGHESWELPDHVYDRIVGCF
ncbi:hypothetical protein BDK51DRAFT_50109 [Blyttiomyces helicus]|uniref:F-box domain-containing protein n=1 Tax=Blyttiomyces helicus TaxID=388810 RepID=A0A4P9VUK5_9FUNG|nr:hypothetical protein BDK51DRAFT_50109 [Blyttiomyces helicus]|eukprot:RKO83279.1 hypothetical protein BDK51DRAFT_50109 [Blyttiomyces helicus]